MWDGIVVILVLAGIGFLIYTRAKDQDLRDTLDEIKELIINKE